MHTKTQLVLAMTVALTTMPTLAAGSAGNSQVWTTSNGAPIVSGNGNPIRTIHYQDPSPKMAATNGISKPSPSLFAVIKKAVTKALNAEPENMQAELPVEQPTQTAKKMNRVQPATLITQATPATLATLATLATPAMDPIPPVIEPQVAALALEKVAPSVEAAVIVTAVKPAKIDYTFNQYKATILFDTGSADLTPEASSSLTQLAMATQKADKIISLKVLGHADTRGDSAYNMSLSEARMLRVASFFDGLKLKVTSMFAKGETSPVMGANGEDHTLSRRVQVLIKTRHVD
jgi:outer membrane protein OmpA-like peptidoglycan-associated protein